MFNKLSSLFKSKKAIEEQLYRTEHAIEFDPERGVIVAGVVLNENLSKRLEYLSNRRLNRFDDLKALYDHAMIMNEKIDLDIAQQRFLAHLGNTEQNLLEFKQILTILNCYYREFKREK